MGLQFISWMENLDEDELPPRSIWFNERELRHHFDRVTKARKEKYGNKDETAGEIEDPVQNEAARSLIVGD